MPSRRQFLAAVGATGLAGCVGEPEPSETAFPSPTPGTASPAAVGEAVTVDGATVTLEQVAVRDSLFVQASADSKDVLARDGERFLLTTVTVEGDAPESADAFSLAVDGETVATGSTTFASNHYGYLDRWPYDPDGERGDPGGWVGFTPEAPLSGESVAVAVGDAGWRLPDEAVDHLQRPLPGYELVSFDYPERVGPEETFTVSVSVENTGPVAGTFRGVLNVANIEYAYYPYPFELTLGAGERGTWEKEFDASNINNSGGLHLRTPVGNPDGTVEVVDPTPTATD